jgi:coproporphyrinogen III oxidase
MRSATTTLFKEIQSQICLAIENIDAKSKFLSDEWNRVDSTGNAGGGGLTRLIRDGNIFEQGGVNFSEVYGKLPAEMSFKLLGIREEKDFFATGVSLVIHPYSPKVPTVHANYRYLEVEDKAWFGGGADLTPFVLNKDDAKHFHGILKKSCDNHDKNFYPKFKEECDKYFYIKHRNETRGVGGVFYDYLGKDEPNKLENYFLFTQTMASSFIPSYLPIVEQRKNENWTEREKEYQLYRRGRYIEFNLVYDRGTHFGLHTGGRTESILMSIPPMAKWQYESELGVNEAELELQTILKNPIKWI